MKPFSFDNDFACSIKLNFQAFLILFLIIIIPFNLEGQCTDGSQPECMCESAEVLCTIDGLDGYTFSMDGFNHPEDAPNPMCAGCGGFCIPQNPTWFAFVAWCTEIDMNVIFSNCEDGTINGFDGVQVAIYSDCGPDFDPVDCDVSSDDCTNNDPKELNLTGLIVGDVYYFMVDGCASATCDIEIDVLGTCGDPVIQPWIDGVVGNEFVCIGDIENYTVDNIDGANTFHWYIDGVELTTTDENLNDITWDSPGVFELCVDGSNDPCVPVDDDPAPICIIITVYEPISGEIVADPEILCPGTFSTVTISAYLDDPDYETSILVTDENGDISDIFMPTSTMVGSDVCQTISVCSYNYNLTFGIPASIGMNIDDLNCDDDCCDVICVEVTFEDTEVPTFVNPPMNTPFACFDLLPPMEEITWEDNCDGTGMVIGVETGSADLCSGGMITRTWEYLDGCDNLGIHMQSLSIGAPPLPLFINPPGDITIDCTPDPILPPNLMVTNAAMGTCLFEDIVIPSITGDNDMCGGEIEVLWEYTDPCDNYVFHLQVITVIEPLVVNFINPPADITLPCDQQEFVPNELLFSNNDPNCLLEGSALPEIVDNSNECGGDVTINWVGLDACDRMIEYIQVITIEPSANPVFLNLPVDMTISCEDPIPDFPDLMYSNSDTDPCLIVGEIEPDVEDNTQGCGGTIIATWAYTDPCDRMISFSQTITIETTPVASFINPPVNTILTCEAFQSFIPENLVYTNGLMNGCIIEGDVDGVILDDVDECGGIVNVLFEVTDVCDRLISYTQVVTVSPAPIASFTTMPANTTSPCMDINNDPPTLFYDNGSLGDCVIDGSVEAFQAGTADECGGVVSNIWTFTDECDRTITHTQIVTFLPAAEPEFINPPENGFLDCDGALPDDLALEYDNFEDNPCPIAGEVEPDISQVANIITLVWNFTNDCTGNTISHTQTYDQSIPVDWEPDYMEYIICEGDAFDLASIGLIDLNNTDPTLTYHDDFPIDASNILSSSIVTPLTPSTYFILGNNIYDCPDFVEVYVDIDDLSVAGSDVFDQVCTDLQFIDLYDFITDDADFNGDFFQESGPDLNLSNPESVNIINAMPGIYTFEYVIEATDFCPESIALITIEILPPVQFLILEVYCSADDLSYVVTIDNDSYDIDIDFGEFVEYTINEVTIGNIPIGNSITIDATNTITGCVSSFEIPPPNCDCPDVLSPVSDGNVVICFGDPIPPITVTPSAGTTVNWFDAPIGGLLLLADGNQYNPIVTNPGLYTFYVEGESLDIPGCLSDVRIPVTLEILTVPEYLDLTIEFCDQDSDGLVSFDSLTLESFINIEATENINYFLNSSDAEFGLNKLMLPFENTMHFGQIIYAVISNSANCRTIIEVDIIIRERPELEVTVTNESCISLEDGMIFIQDFNPSLTYTLDENIISNESILNLQSGEYELIFIDEFGCQDTSLIVIEDGLILNLDSFAFICDDNGTDTDPDDDIYTISLLISNNHNNTGTYSVIDSEANMYGTFIYGSLSSFTFPADGNTLDLSFIDDANACDLSQIVGPLIPCSSNCIISVEQLNIECYDNGTPSDPADDFYEIEVSTSAVNGSVIDRYTISINGVITYNFAYNVVSTFTLPADGSIYNIGFSDAEDFACLESMSIGPLIPCSDDCLISALVTEITCENNGTEQDNEDDVFYFTLSVSGLNNSMGFSINELSFNGNYETPYDFGPYNIADGDLILSITDNDDLECLDQITVIPPLACSDCNQSIAIIGGTILSCLQPTISLEVSASEQGDYEWNGPDGFTASTSMIEVSNPGIYSVSVLFQNACVQVQEIVVDIEEDTPAAVASQDQLLTCNNLVAVLDGSASTYPDNALFNWSNQNGVFISNEIITEVTSPGNYLLQITNPLSGCSSLLDTVVVIQTTDGPDVQVVTDPLDGNELTVITNIPLDEIDFISWTPEDILSCSDCVSTTLLNVADGLIVSVSVTDLNGCTSTESINFNIETEINVPNIFNPNSSNGNQNFTLYGNDQVAIIEDMSIYDRWGNLVYQAQNIPPNQSDLGWDGRLNNREVEQGVYLYLFQVRLMNGELLSKAGDVTVLR